MTDYKSTLNLPSTKFPMKANLSNREPAQLAAWQAEDIYQKVYQHRAGQPTFVLHDGPPYANGGIHVGHALNKILKDIVLKSKSLAGFQVHYTPGWDCHGLPIELIVEKKHGKANHKISATAFRKKCRDYAHTQIQVQRDAFQRLGVFADWDKPYLTMAYQYEAQIIRSLAKIIANGHLEQGFKPVYWCLDCQSALAEAEVEYHPKTSPSIDVRFVVCNPEHLYQQLALTPPTTSSLVIPIWTTTPWTLPANQAVALHPQLSYALVEVTHSQGTEILVIAEELVTTCLARYGCTQSRIITQFAGQLLTGIHCQHPFEDRQVPVVMGEHVTTESGTGCVHTAPGHGTDDFALAKKYQLPLTSPVGDNGCYTANTALFAGIHVNQVAPQIITTLRHTKTLLHHDTINHSYPHCWRHKTATIFRATPQWFISMDQAQLRQHALQAATQVTWIPQWGLERMSKMMQSRPDWCISRQRAWGVPIPLLVHRDTKQLHPKTQQIMETVAQRIEQAGIEAWFECDISSLITDADQYTKVTDTLDVWFDSGVSHSSAISHQKPLSLPADLYLEGSDQHRGWFQSALLTATAMYGKAPYKTVLTHGFTVDEQGYKMSKSRGNVIAPDTIIKQYGADILRLWVAASDYRTEQSLSTEILSRISDVYRRIRNTARFLLANLFDFDPTVHRVKNEELLSLDRYILAKAHHLQEEILHAYDGYQFHHVYQKVHHFCAIELGSFYLDVIKDRQYTCHKESIARRSCQTAMHHILQALTRWLAPILSFTAEEIWQLCPGKTQTSIFLCTWYDELATFTGKTPLSGETWETLVTLRDEVNKQLEISRQTGAIGSSLAAEITLYVIPALKHALDQLGSEIRFLFITSAAHILPHADKPKHIPDSAVTGLSIQVEPSTQKKCSRCWHRRHDIGANPTHPALCERCVTNLSLPGENRQYV
jgi:isoleucyl-tRNA synthetase